MSDALLVHFLKLMMRMKARGRNIDLSREYGGARSILRAAAPKPDLGALALPIVALI